MGTFGFCPGGIGLDEGAVLLDFCNGGTGRDGQSVPLMLSGEVLFLFLANRDLSLPHSSSSAGKASVVAKVEAFICLGFGEALNGSWDLFREVLYGCKVNQVRR